MKRMGDSEMPFELLLLRPLPVHLRIPSGSSKEHTHSLALNITNIIILVLISTVANSIANMKTFLYTLATLVACAMAQDINSLPACEVSGLSPIQLS